MDTNEQLPQSPAPDVAAHDTENSPLAASTETSQLAQSIAQPAAEPDAPAMTEEKPVTVEPVLNSAPDQYESYDKLVVEFGKEKTESGAVKTTGAKVLQVLGTFKMTESEVDYHNKFASEGKLNATVYLPAGKFKVGDSIPA